MKFKFIIIILLSFIACYTSAQTDKAITNKIDSNILKRLFFAGLSDKLNENYVAAAINFNKIVAIDINNEAAYFELANANLKLDKLEDSEANILKAIKLNNNKWYWMLLAEIYKKQNSMLKLTGVFNTLISIEPENEFHYYNLAIAQGALNQLDKAKATYQLIETKFGDSKQLQLAKQRLARNDGNAADNDILKLLESNKANIDNYIYAAELFLRRNNLTDALNVLNKAKTLESNNFQVNILLAEVYRKQKNEKASFEALKLAFDSDKMPLDTKVKIVMGLFPGLGIPLIAEQVSALTKNITLQNPTNAKVFALYGDVLYQTNNYKGALESYQKSIALNNQIYAVWEQIINVQIVMGQYQDAIKTGEEAVSMYPNQAKLYYFTAFALFKTGKTKEALNDLKNVYQLDSENKNLTSQAYALEGDIFINQNNFSSAKLSFEKSISIDPENYLVMNNYAYYLALRDDELSKAESLAAKASAAMPNSASVADTYAYVLFKLKKYNLAQFWIEKALQNNTAKSGVYFERYGDILFMQGRVTDAVVQWTKSKELGNNSEVLIKKINEKKYFK